MIFANGVVPHFTVNELQITLRKAHKALNSQGVLAFSAKSGMGSAWVHEKSLSRRYINYWRLQPLSREIERHGYKVVFTSRNEGQLEGHRWINVVARKIG